MALDNFGHLSNKDRSVLVDYPLHNLAALSDGSRMGTLLPSPETVTSLSEHEDDGGASSTDALPSQADASLLRVSDQVMMEEKDVLEEEDEGNGLSSQTNSSHMLCLYRMMHEGCRYVNCVLFNISTL